MKKGAISLLIAATAAITAYGRPTVLTLKESIQDSTIVYPESFETDTHELMKNWYLQNYTVIDDSGAEKTDVPATKEDYITRLQNLPTVIEMPYNDVVRSYIEMYTQRRRSLVEEMLGLSIYYMPIFEQALEKEGLPLELKYLPVIESALNPDAVSRVGATGLWQFMIGTAKGLGLDVNTLVDERRDPFRSSEMAAKYLKQLYGMYGDWSLAIASYNCGPGNVNKAMRRAGGGKKDFWDIYFYLPAETRGYVPAFIAANYVMTYYQDHNLGKALARRPVLTDTVRVTKRVHFEQIASVLNVSMEELRVLNPQYRRDEIPGDIHPYTLTLPSKQVYSYIVSEDSILAHNSSNYARRAEVEPKDKDAGMTTKLVVKYHTVKKGETISNVARKYGVTTSSIRKWNGLRSNRLKKGQKLKINTYQKVAIEELDDKAEEQLAAANAKVEAAVADKQEADAQEEQAYAASDETEEPEAQQKPEEKAPLKYHKVARGESLGSIAAAYGVTSDDLKKWNGLKSNRINAGTRLKVYSDRQPEKAGGEVAASNPKTGYHIVRRGETLSSIAAKYGVTVDNLKDWNNINGNSINAGQKLAVNEANASGAKTSSASDGSARESVYTVKKGDTLSSIADKNGVTVSDLQEWNGLKGNSINAGQQLVVKGGSAKSSKSSAKNTQKNSYKSYKVRSGETLGGIAERNGTTAAAIRKANGIKGSNIRAGQVLKIPQ